ncbi:hypothetical protein [Aureibacter tunicatorum]|uniref:Uncharacterized protein n=1 Tax=Aureibacter tunicatorum TaxID=866807 RepID=A0AAE3XNY6_9BACT|nr:hypothetical protein [Aureibacter tunicatorum]MDR6239370.1 hypothetical protein [Aureibacter tunicatorum]BDD04707.1 hypothetical protein AUTU_21900 [Aureibacter tunicatorum]
MRETLDGPKNSSKNSVEEKEIHKLARTQLLALAIGISFFLMGVGALKFLENISIVSSICFGLGIAIIVHYLFGGLGSNKINFGVWVATGVLAGVMGIVYFIDIQLSKQMQIRDLEGKLVLGRDWHVFDDSGLRLGEMEKGSISLSKDYEVYLNDTISVGSIKSRLGKLGLFDSLHLMPYSEVKYFIRKKNFRADVDKSHWNEPNDFYKTRYNDLPFTIKPVFDRINTYGNGIATQVILHEKDTVLESFTKKTNFDIEYGDVTYVVRIRNLDLENHLTNKNYVVYQIFGYKKHGLD